MTHLSPLHPRRPSYRASPYPAAAGSYLSRPSTASTALTAIDVRAKNAYRPETCPVTGYVKSLVTAHPRRPWTTRLACAASRGTFTIAPKTRTRTLHAPTIPAPAVRPDVSRGGPAWVSSVFFFRVYSVICPSRAASTPSRSVTTVATVAAVVAPTIKRGKKAQPEMPETVSTRRRCCKTRGRQPHPRSPAAEEAYWLEGEGPFLTRYPSRRQPPFCPCLAREELTEAKPQNRRIFEGNF